MRSKLLTLAAGLALVAIAGRFFAVPLLAQVRAALVQNVDERGRIPYQSGSPTTNCISTSLQCDVYFPAVPNNKRLVITHFDAVVFVKNPGGLIFLGLHSAAPFGALVFPEFTATAPATAPFVGQNTFVSGRAVLYYVDAGDTPIVHFSATQPVSPFSTTLTGYLLDCTSGCAAMAQ